MVAFAAVLLLNGKVLCADDMGLPGTYRSFLFNPANNEMVVPTHQPSEDLMCGGNVHLPDERVLFIAGLGADTVGSERVILFDPVEAESDSPNTWTEVDPLFHDGLVRKRWYPTLTTLPNGSVLLAGGTSSLIPSINPPCANCPGSDCGDLNSAPNLSNHAFLPVILKPDEISGSQQEWLDSIDSSHNYKAGRDLTWYPYNFVLTNGRVFMAGAVYTRFYCNTQPRICAKFHTGLSAWSDVTDVSTDGATAAMFKPDQIFKCGSGSNENYQDAIATAWVCSNALVSSPTWTRVDDAQQTSHFLPRYDCESVLMPDGKIFVVGGSSDSFQDTDEGNAVKTPQIFDPTAQCDRWTNLAQHTKPLGYHAVALLLPDGRILTGGGDHLGGHNRSIEIFRPPYLFSRDDEYPPPTRPVIHTAPGTLIYDTSYIISLDGNYADEIRQVNLVKLGATTHGFDQDQRFVPLTFDKDSESELKIAAPENAQLAPPGHYMLFVLRDSDRAGVLYPSVAIIVKVAKE